MVSSTVAVSGLLDTGEAKSWSNRLTRSGVLTGHANKNYKEWEFKAVVFVKSYLVTGGKEQFFSFCFCPILSSYQRI